MSTPQILGYDDIPNFSPTSGVQVNTISILMEPRPTHLIYSTNNNAIENRHIINFAQYNHNRQNKSKCVIEIIDLWSEFNSWLWIHMRLDGSNQMIICHTPRLLHFWWPNFSHRLFNSLQQCIFRHLFFNLIFSKWSNRVKLHIVL